MGPIVAELFSFFFPMRCICCGSVTGGEAFCNQCEQWVEPDDNSDPTQPGAAFIYEGSVRTVIIAFKNRGDHEAGRTLARLGATLLQQTLSPEPMDLVVPVPSGRSSLRRRGYNPAAIVAHELARALSIPLAPTALERSPWFKGQKGKSAVERMASVQGVYKVARPDKVAGRAVLLIDDVVTTGATLAACSQELTHAGASRVVCFALARTP